MSAPDVLLASVGVVLVAAAVVRFVYVRRRRRWRLARLEEVAAVRGAHAAWQHALGERWWDEAGVIYERVLVERHYEERRRHDLTVRSWHAELERGGSAS